jgi:hypothetical protein
MCFEIVEYTCRFKSKVLHDQGRTGSFRICLLTARQLRRQASTVEAILGSCSPLVAVKLEHSPLCQNARKPQIQRTQAWRIHEWLLVWISVVWNLAAG